MTYGDHIASPAGRRRRRGRTYGGARPSGSVPVSDRVGRPRGTPRRCRPASACRIRPGSHTSATPQGHPPDPREVHTPAQTPVRRRVRTGQDDAPASPEPPGTSTPEGDRRPREAPRGRHPGLSVMATVTPSDTTGRDTARELLRRLRIMQPGSPRSGPTAAPEPAARPLVRRLPSTSGRSRTRPLARGLSSFLRTGQASGE